MALPPGTLSESFCSSGNWCISGLLQGTGSPSKSLVGVCERPEVQVTTVIPRLSNWLASELADLPPGLTAVYVEFGESVSPDQVLSVYADAFGFERLSDDPTDPAHVGELGEFVWQARNPPHFPAADYRNVEWLSALEAATRSPKVEQVALGRGLRLLVGEHDGEVRVVR